MSTNLATTTLRELEYGLLQCDSKALSPGSTANTILDIVRDVIEGNFKAALSHDLARTVLSLSEATSFDREGNLTGELNFNYIPPSTLDGSQQELLLLSIGVASLHAFVQVNWTGPDLDTDPCSILHQHNQSKGPISAASLHAAATSRLALGGEPAYHLTKYPTFLAIALDIFNLPYQHCLSSNWWKLRATAIHQQVLDEPVGLEVDSLTSALEGLRDSLKLSDAPDLNGRLSLEQGTLNHILANDKVAAELFVKAAKETGLQYELTGALGKRTKFQITDHSQLVVLAQSRSREGVEAKESIKTDEIEQEKDLTTRVPETIKNEDDTLLEQTEFTSTVYQTPGDSTSLSHIDPSNQPALHPLDQCILLGLCLNVKNTSPSHGLTKEQMSPYVARVMSHPRNWTVHTMALLLRSRLEADRTRTVERSTLQLQALIDQMPTADSTVKERLLYFHDIVLPSKWEMEKELAMRFLSLGVIKSALEIFERLEMWEHVVQCWQGMERRDKGVTIVKDLLEGSRTEAELVISRARSGGQVRPALDTARTAKLWCLLGDLEPDHAEEHYRKAWEISGHKSGRAIRSLGGYYFTHKNFPEAAEYLRQATAINPLLSRTWFLLGCALIRLEKWEEARDVFSRCVTIDDEDGESWNNLASVYLRMGAAENKQTDSGEADDDATLVEDTTLTSQRIPYANKLLAFRALKQGLKHSHNNWRMWSNYMLVSADVGEMAETCRAMSRVVEERAVKDGEECIDFDVLDRLVDAVTRADDDDSAASGGQPATQSADSQYNPNTGKRLAPRVADLFSRTLLPRFSSSPRLFRIYARFLVWQSAWGAALEAHINAYRASVVNDERVATDLERFKGAIVELEELVDVMRNLGPRAIEESQRSGTAEGEEGRRRKTNSWQFQARGLVRTFMGRTRESFGDQEPEWNKLEELLEELRS
ncbi:hypothetical protein FRB90_011233 [Tulasnella sp. 427]|nr:hypothetical protein FRB90_011233 [Tulasnella sp. 427]